MRHKGLFLDLDGTLADTLPSLRTAYFQFLDGFDVIGTDAEFDSLNGPPLLEICKQLRAVHQLDHPLDKLCERYAALMREAHSNSKPADGAECVLEFAEKRGWRIMVVTSSPAQSAWQWLEDNNLRSRIAGLVGGDEVKRGKPDPEPYGLALQRLHADRNRSLAVEDSTQGLHSALTAGLPGLIVGGTPPDELLVHPCYVGRIALFSDLTNYLDPSSWA